MEINFHATWVISDYIRQLTLTVVKLWLLPVTVHEMFLHKTMQIPGYSLNLKHTELKIYSLSSNFEIQSFYSLDTMLKLAFQAQLSRGQNWILELQGVEMLFQKIKVESRFNGIVPGMLAKKKNKKQTYNYSNQILTTNVFFKFSYLFLKSVCLPCGIKSQRAMKML